MTTSMVYHAAANGVKIDELTSEFEGDLDLQGFLGLSDGGRPGFQAIRVKTDGSTERLNLISSALPCSTSYRVRFRFLCE